MTTSTIGDLLQSFDERYSVDQVLTGSDHGKFAAKFNGLKIGLFDIWLDAINYTHQYQALRVSSFNVTMDNLIAMGAE